MVEIKKMEKINEIYDPNKIEKILKAKFNISPEDSQAYSYKNRINQVSPKLKLLGKPADKEVKAPEPAKKESSSSEYIVQPFKPIDPKDNVNDLLKLEVEKKRLEVISHKLHETDEKITSSHLDNIVEKGPETVDYLLEALNKQVGKVDDEQPFMESISFLDNKPKIEKVPLKNLGVSHLYAKIDAIENKINKSRVIQTEYINQNQSAQKQKEISALIEEIEIPEIISIKDDTNISQTIATGYSSHEHEAQPHKEHEHQFVLDDGKVTPNPHIEINIQNQRNNIYQKSKKNDKPKENYKDLMRDMPIPTLEEQEEHQLAVPKLKIKSPQKTAFDYILPADSEEGATVVSSQPTLEKSTLGSKSQDLIYTIKPKISNIDRTHLSEKYNIDEFTFVNITYTMDKGMVYNIIQPELNQSQEETYQEIKRLFLDSIDSNYLSFKGDKQTINNYIQKIFDLTIDKLPYGLTDLEKKLYFNFIKRDFSGFGFLSSILEDKNIIEISCSGENMPIIAYHLMYGGLETNMKFENIFKLNQYVLSLSKIMGLQVNSAQPMISGYLPNGYKVEGLYSVGDTSNKGSSFIIKKYLEEPLTPVSLINLGIGTTDVFSYIWTAMDEGYQVVIVGGDNAMLLSALAQFYPDKKITSVQSYDYLKLPQKNWIKKLILDSTSINKKTIISQVISQRSDYLILDNFTPDLFDTKWYDISLLYMEKELLNKYLEKAKATNLNLVVINLERTNINQIEQMQITRITEVYNSNEYDIVKYSDKEVEFHINLISSNINIVDYNKHKLLLRWLVDSEIKDSLDFNNIVNDYYKNKEYLFKKLNISEETN